LIIKFPFWRSSFQIFNHNLIASNNLSASVNPELAGFSCQEQGIRVSLLPNWLELLGLVEAVNHILHCLHFLIHRMRLKNFNFLALLIGSLFGNKVTDRNPVLGKNLFLLALSSLNQFFGLIVCHL
jgi:hypothetical protein